MVLGLGLGLSVGAAALVGCGSEGNSSTEKPNTDPDSATAADSVAPGYRTWMGPLPGTTQRLTLHLVEAPVMRGGAHPANLETTVATYTVAGSGTTHLLYLRPTTPDSLVLEEELGINTGSADHTAIWRFKRTETALSGTRGGRPLTLRLGRSPGSVTLTPHFFVDSMVADARFPTSARAQVSLLAVLPNPTAPTLTTAVLGAVRGDSAALTPAAPPLPAQWAQMRTEFEAEYRADVDTMRQQEGDSAVVAGTLNYALNYSARVLWNEDGLLSLGRMVYEYRGGAHGMNYTTVSSFDSETGRRLTFDDVFSLPDEKAKKALSTVLDAVARLQYGLAPNATLGGEDGEGPLFVAHIPITRNVCLTGGGVLFVYPPYDLASFADGEIELFVPFSELQGLLKPGLPGVRPEALTRR